jgi:hypothetical protein
VAGAQDLQQQCVGRRRTPRNDDVDRLAEAGIGAGPLADATAAGLRRDGRRFRHFSDAAETDGRLCRAAVVLLAGLVEPAALVAEIGARCRRRPAGLPPLRLIPIADNDADASAISQAELPPDLPVRLEPLVVDRRAAQLLLRRWPLHLGADPRFGQPIHVVIAGRAAPADALLLEVLRAGHYSSERPPHVTLLDDDPLAWQGQLQQAHPQAWTFSRLRFLALDDPALTAAPPVTSLFVLCDPPPLGLDVAEALMRRLAAAQRVSPPTVLEVGDAEPHGTLADWDGQLFPVSHRREVLSAPVLLDGEGDALARVIHDHYRDTTEAQGRDPSQEAATRPWPALAESYRDANSRQAEHLWAKLAVTDCRVEPLEQVESFAFTPAEVERLAMIEHDRWAADRWLDGWHYAPKRDNARKHHPQLIPFAELAAPMKDLDRFAVRLAPTLLARSGLGIMRMLLVGCLPAPAGIAPGRLRPLMQTVLERLVARYPDRGLTVAATLADAPSRLFARLAADGFGAGLFLLGDRPVGELLALPLEGGDASAQYALRTLLSRAERRIPLPAEGDPARWLHERAEVLIQVAAPGAAAPEPAAIGAKVVVIDTDGDRLDWGFEY